MARWAALYRAMEAGLAATPGPTLVRRPEEGTYVGSSFQFRLPDWSPARIVLYLTRCSLPAGSS